LSPVTSGRTASAGRATSSRVISHWMDARIDSFASMAVAVKPGVSVGTRKPRMPSSVAAQMTATSAIEASPIHRLAPLRTQPPSEPRTAVVAIAPGSDPAVGSVSPKQPMSSPAAMPGRYRFFCSSDPNLRIADIASDPCTDTKVRSPESPASSSRAAIPYSTAERPGQP
jgi:hypothetical protein